MGRKIWAFVAFNFYAAFIISAFQENTAYLYEASLIRDMKVEGIAVDPREWDWGDHYVWRLFSGLVVTAIVGFLAGAIARTRGALTSAISNIPSILIWGAMIYLFGFSDVELEEKTAFLIVSVIAIPLTTYVAFIAGRFGEEVQNSEYEDNTVLGVKPYHWIWALFPIYWYALGIVYVVTKFIAFQFAIWGDTGIIVAIMSLLALLPILAWGYPLLLVHQVLTGEKLSEQNGFVRAVANFGIIVLGIGTATGLQVASYWLLAKIAV